MAFDSKEKPGGLKAKIFGSFWISLVFVLLMFGFFTFCSMLFGLYSYIQPLYFALAMLIFAYYGYFAAKKLGKGIWRILGEVALMAIVISISPVFLAIGGRMYGAGAAGLLVFVMMLAALLIPTAIIFGAIGAAIAERQSARAKKN